MPILGGGIRSRSEERSIGPSKFTPPASGFVAQLTDGLRALDEAAFLMPGFEERLRETLVLRFQHEFVEEAIKRDDRSRHSLMFTLATGTAYYRLSSDTPPAQAPH